MKVHRFIGTFDLTRDRVEIQDADLVHRMGRVLRLQIKEEIVLCDGQGTEARGVVEHMDRNMITVQIRSRTRNMVESPVQLTLYLACIKRESFELALQKAVEVGVSVVVPLITDRTIKPTLNRVRLQMIMREAAEQSGRGCIATMMEPMVFEAACIHAKNKGSVFFCDTEGEGRDTLERVRSSQNEARPRSLFIGPEGGWTDGERAMAERHEFAFIGLGRGILRAETAAIVASYLLSSI